MRWFSDVECESDQRRYKEATRCSDELTAIFDKLQANFQSYRHYAIENAVQMGGCAAINCSNSGRKGFRLYRFPTDPERHRKWVANTRRDFVPTVGSRLCEVHFDSSQFEQNRSDGWKKLKPNAIPTIFNFDQASEKTDVRKKSKPRSPQAPKSELPEPFLNDSTPGTSEHESEVSLIQRKIHERGTNQGELSQRMQDLINENAMLRAENDSLQLQMAEMKDKLSPFLHEEQQINALKGKGQYERRCFDSIIKAVKSRFNLDEKEQHEQPEGGNEDYALCRLCTSRSAQTVNIFETELGPLNLDDVIGQCLDIEISKDDVLPKDVCLTCCDKVREYFDFYTLCSDSQRSFADGIVSQDESEEIDAVEESTMDHKPDNASEGMIIFTNTTETAEPSGTARRKVRKPRKYGYETQDELDLDLRPVRSAASDENIADSSIVFNDRADTIKIVEDDSTDDTPRISTKEVFENYSWECVVCGEDQISMESLKQHYLEAHEQPAKFKCTKCGKVFTIYRSFVRHVKIHLQPQRFGCLKCGKRFSQKTTLQAHQMLHTNERPYVCSLCGKAFKQYSALYVHMRSHLPEQAKLRFNCPVCRKGFSSNYGLENHLKLHTGERNYPCDICGRRFVAKGSLNYHILSHVQDKTYSCSLCTKSFRTSRLLAKHASFHSGVKPHQCDVCGKQFRERSALMEHARIHTGEMPYVCEYCGKAFRFKGILTIHIRQHTGERPYRCAECGRTFANWANYNKHTTIQHGRTHSFGNSAPSPSVSLPSLDFVDPSDLTLSADGLNIQEFVVDHELFQIPSSRSTP